ncbi:MAG: ComF family protein [Proteobacteria bacterium]|nr:ComF family protein [Pseudomonadota bacterium]
MRKIKNLINFTINLIFPNTCFTCGKLLGHMYYTGICPDCYKNLKLFNIAYHPELNSLIKSSHIDSFNAPFIYSEQISKLILEFKFHDQEERGHILAKLITPSLKQIENFETCLIIPVPIHKKRLLSRKYNQASILSKKVAKQNKLEHSNEALKRIKNTPHQTGQSKARRMKQLKNSFLANPNIIENRRIILIDDVFTTGSTANICAKELKNKGAKQVHVLTIAYTAL